jgi:hypothetical protein
VRHFPARLFLSPDAILAITWPPHHRAQALSTVPGDKLHLAKDTFALNTTRQEGIDVTTMDFSRLRAAPKSKTDSFETVAVHLFLHLFRAPLGSTFHPLRGDGGDGGVEAYFVFPTGEVAGVQAKYFFKLGASELGQIDGSLTTALANHPTLTTYWIYVPFNLTGKKAMGKLGKSETEKFEEWRQRRISDAQKQGRPLEIELCGAQKIQAQIHAVDLHGGFRRYWFDDAVLTQTQIRAALNQARQYAGPRYTADLDVRTEVHEALDFFGGIGDLPGWMAKIVRPLKIKAQDLLSVCDKVIDVLPAAQSADFKKSFSKLATRLSALRTAAHLSETAGELTQLVLYLEPVAQRAREAQELAFVKAHGEGRDTAGFRQFMAEYQVSFPAEAMDRSREMTAFLKDIRDLVEHRVVNLIQNKSFLLVGPAGIGKTHAIVSAAERRLAFGGFTLVVFGDDFSGVEPWEVIRTKLGFGSHIGRDELFSCVNACAASTNLPFLIAIDALNESPRNARWRDKLPELVEQLKPFDGIRICVSTRDTYMADLFDSRFPGLAFTAPGFAGREFLAIQEFAKHYHLATGIAPILASELANPLFLHLACQALVDQGHTSLDLSLPGFLALLETHLKRTDSSVRSALQYRNPANMVRKALLALSEQLVSQSMGANNWDNCIAVIGKSLGAEIKPGEFLDQLQKENLVILSQSDTGEWFVRLAFQRYGDFLRAGSLIEACIVDGKVDLDQLRGRLVGVSVEREGLLEALAVVLPERAAVELMQPALALDVAESTRPFIRGLLWRSRASYSSATNDCVFASLATPQMWQEVYEAAFQLALVPDHPMNAGQFLDHFLRGQALTVRDSYLSFFAYKSFESNGAIFSLLAACLRADVALWPEESGYLAGIALAWLCSCADRRVRDRGIKSLARLIAIRPRVGTKTIEKFNGIDDDYITEALAIAAYGAALRTARPVADFKPVLGSFMAVGYHLEPNALFREHVALLAEFLGETDARKPELKSLFRSRQLPDAWPTAKSVESLSKLERLPSNMKLVGGGLLPDFWRYRVEPLLRIFDLVAAGVNAENLGAWIMQEAMDMGYPGKDRRVLEYDRVIDGIFGSGRSRPGYAERLGKKYYWIALHRLVALMADHFPLRADWHGEVPDRNRLWSIDLRKIDPTDLRDLNLEHAYPDEVLQGPAYPFPARDTDLVGWVKVGEFSPHQDCLLRIDSTGTEWVTLSLAANADDRGDDEDILSSTYLRVSLSYDSMMVSNAVPMREHKEIVEHQRSDQPPTSYRTYLGEYPNGRAFKESVSGMEESSDLPFTEVSLLRGSNWEYDYASDDRMPNLDVPEPGIVNELDLQWDGYRGWRTTDGALAAFSSSLDDRSGLFIRRDLLKRHLQETNRRLLYRRFVNMNVNAPENEGPSADMNASIRWDVVGRVETLASEREVFDGRH